MSSTEENLPFDPVEKLGSDLGKRPIRESLDPVQERSQSILANGRPETIVQVVGSNGKGSVVHYLENLLDRSGLLTVSYVSPHLSELRERIHLGARALSEWEFRNQLLDLPSELHNDFTPFERLFMTALRLSVKRSADVLVLEAGMGGRWDATSAVAADWTVLTSVDREHTDFLGSRKVDILREQLDQIPSGSHLMSPEFTKDELSNERSRIINDRSLSSVQLNQPGDPDTLNRNLSLNLARFLTDRTVESLQEELQTVERPPGRKEVLSVGERNVLLDVAHSPAALREWIRFTREREGDPDAVLYIFGCLAGKELAANVEVLSNHINPRNLWFTRPPSPRALDPQKLLNAWPSSSKQKPRVVPELHRVGQKFRDRPEEFISIAGSFTLVGHFRDKYI